MTKIIQIGNPVLRKISKKVVDVGSEKTKKIVKDLIKVMRDNNLIGVAAPQIGVSERIFLTELRTTKARKSAIGDEEKGLKIFINPKILGYSEEMVEMWEGCGSVAESNFFVPVIRPMAVVIEALDIEGKKFKLITKDLLARVIQHEYDHLDGVVFLDRNCDVSRAMSGEEYYKMMEKG